jgi:serine/threonine-protein kinase HipA
MNLPEGALPEAIRRAIAKIIGDDDLSILLATGGNQIGRNRFSNVESSSPAQPGEPHKI